MQVLSGHPCLAYLGQRVQRAGPWAGSPDSSPEQAWFLHDLGLVPRLFIHRWGTPTCLLVVGAGARVPLSGPQERTRGQTQGAQGRLGQPPPCPTRQVCLPPARVRGPGHQGWAGCPGVPPLWSCSGWLHVEGTSPWCVPTRCQPAKHSLRPWVPVRRGGGSNCSPAAPRCQAQEAGIWGRLWLIVQAASPGAWMDWVLQSRQQRCLSLPP